MANIIKVVDTNGKPQELTILHNQLVSLSHNFYNSYNGYDFIIRGGISDLDAAHSYQILIRTANAPFHILSLNAQVSGAATGYFYEGVTITNLGTEITAYCTNREKGTKSAHKYYGGNTETSGQVVSTVGATLFLSTVFIGTANKNINDASSLDERIILKRNTDYLIKIDNDESASDIKLDISLVWGEVEV